MFELSKEFLNKKIELFTLSEIKKLSNLIKSHSDLYYNKSEPIISDKQYDDLFKKLEFLENKFDIKDKQSLKIWANFVESSFKKVKHSRPMISLDNTYNEDELKDLALRSENVKKYIEKKQIKYKK